MDTIKKRNSVANLLMIILSLATIFIGLALNVNNQKDSEVVSSPMIALFNLW